MLTLLVVAMSLSADPTPAQTQLLQTFHAEFIPITPGEKDFPATLQRTLGDGKTVEIRFEQPFSVAKYEVPQDLFKAVTGNDPSRWKGDRNSVEEVNRDEAIAFCRQATQLMRSAKLIGADEEIRLPTESEWEYVARAGTDTIYSFGNKVADLDDYAWHTGNAAGNDPPVGTKKPNPWGLYDIHGYLWEWCADDWSSETAKLPVAGQAVQSAGAAHGVLRGGSWKDKAEKLTSYYRYKAATDLRDDAVGFRCILARTAKN
ncbi:formylglycine-generating enzyme family protein [Lignipirellula cremea]|uniref:Serine/threonine-protein kinase pkn1 n=1 Tax=Lignipirellula cremea TaxID=2528010 RepID=A0A518DWC6_9BACT|nr:formylglycine-generating enzyme family protein [Lignipirellula cremea]QDU96134.1 Serine/threonine-protein kinase pkn1 [Lignipirellula cremea]